MESWYKQLQKGQQAKITPTNLFLLINNWYATNTLKEYCRSNMKFRHDIQMSISDISPCCNNDSESII